MIFFPFNLFESKIKNLLSFSSYSLMNIFLFFYFFFFCGTLRLNGLQFNIGEQRHLKEFLLKSSGSNVPYIVSLVNYFTNNIPFVSSSLELLFNCKKKKKKLFKKKKVNVKPL